MSVDFEAIRKQEWPVLEQMVFLDAACVSFAPQRTVRAVKAFADMTATQEEENSSAHHIAMDSLRGRHTTKPPSCSTPTRRRSPWWRAPPMA